jgi:Regulator of ribonuclease activity B
VGFIDRFRQERPPPDELDRVILGQLRGKGANLALARHVLHFLYFADEPSATAAAEDVEDIGFDATVVAPTDDGAQWLVRAEATRVVDETTVNTHRAQFERIAAAHDGDYDGWEAAAEP